MIHKSITNDRVIRIVNENQRYGHNTGVCKNCGKTQDGCEPDARNYVCDHCGSNAVDGAEELLMAFMVL